MHHRRRYIHIRVAAVGFTVRMDLSRLPGALWYIRYRMLELERLRHEGEEETEGAIVSNKYIIC